MKSIKLNNGTNIPSLGFGVCLVQDHEQCKQAVLPALVDRNAGFFDMPEAEQEKTLTGIRASY